MVADVYPTISAHFFRCVHFVLSFPNSNVCSSRRAVRRRTLRRRRTRSWPPRYTPGRCRRNAFRYGRHRTVRYRRLILLYRSITNFITVGSNYGIGHGYRLAGGELSLQFDLRQLRHTRHLLVAPQHHGRDRVQVSGRRSPSHYARQSIIVYFSVRAICTFARTAESVR